MIGHGNPDSNLETRCSIKEGFMSEVSVFYERENRSKIIRIILKKIRIIQDTQDTPKIVERQDT
jgi:hypothetical protein